MLTYAHVAGIRAAAPVAQQVGIPSAFRHVPSGAAVCLFDLLQFLCQHLRLRILWPHRRFFFKKKLKQTAKQKIDW